MLVIMRAHAKKDSSKDRRPDISYEVWSADVPEAGGLTYGMDQVSSLPRPAHVAHSVQIRKRFNGVVVEIWKNGKRIA